MPQCHVAVHAILIDCSKSTFFEIPSPKGPLSSDTCPTRDQGLDSYLRIRTQPVCFFSLSHGVQVSRFSHYSSLVARQILWGTSESAPPLNVNFGLCGSRSLVFPW